MEKNSRPIIVQSVKGGLKDSLKNQLSELFKVRNPKTKLTPDEAGAEAFKNKNKNLFNLVYFPWRGVTAKLLPEAEFYEVLTARNKNLITKTEQDKFKDASIGIAGLSVGSSVAWALVLEGAQNLKLADFDQLELSNLNRVRASVLDLDLPKIAILAKQLYELNPYLNLELVDTGADDGFVENLDILIDEIDSLEVKLRFRELAKEKKLPVVSAADNGDGAIVDIQRFDLESNYEIFHGDLFETDITKVKALNFKDKIKLIGQMVGIKYVTPKMMASVVKVGQDLYSWPQLGGAAMLCGASLVYVARSILLGSPLKSGKYDISLDKIFSKNL